MNDTSVDILFDTHACISIIALKCVMSRHFLVCYMPHISLIKTVGDQCMFSNKIVRDCVIIMGKHWILTYLLVFDIPKYDVVLSMDWLSRNYVQIDCAKWELVLSSSEIIPLCTSAGDVSES